MVCVCLVTEKGQHYRFYSSSADEYSAILQDLSDVKSIAIQPMILPNTYNSLLHFDFSSAVRVFGTNDVTIIVFGTKGLEYDMHCFLSILHPFLDRRQYVAHENNKGVIFIEIFNHAVNANTRLHSLPGLPLVRHLHHQPTSSSGWSKSFWMPDITRDSTGLGVLYLMCRHDWWEFSFIFHETTSEYNQRESSGSPLRGHWSDLAVISGSVRGAK